MSERHVYVTSYTLSRPCQQTKKPLRETTKNHVQQLDHDLVTSYTDMLLRRVNFFGESSWNDLLKAQE